MKEAKENKSVDMKFYLMHAWLEKVGIGITWGFTPWWQWADQWRSAPSLWEAPALDAWQAARMYDRLPTVTWQTLIGPLIVTVGKSSEDLD